MDDLVQQAIDLANAGQQEDALRLLRSAVYHTPNDISAWKWLAATTSDPREALEATERVLRLNPNDAWALQAVLTYRRQAQSVVKRQPAQPQPISPPYARTAAPKQKKRGLLATVALMISGLAVTMAVIVFLGWVALISFQREQQASAGVLNPDTPENAPTLLPGDEQVVIVTQDSGFVTPQPGTLPTADPNVPLPTPVPEQIFPTAIPVTVPPIPTVTPIPESVVENADGSPLIGVQPNVEILQNNAYYPVTGVSESSLRDSLYANGPYVERLNTRALGLTTYEMSVEWQALQLPNQCRVSDMVINLDILYTLPNWEPNGAPPAGLQQDWDAFSAYVTDHENTHGEIAINCANSIANNIALLPQMSSCQDLTASVNQVVDQGYVACESEQVEFDRVYGQTSFPLP